MEKEKEFIMKPKNDFCFKELMMDDEVRKGFLAACLHIDPEEIKETRILPTHLRKKHKDDKLGILDVRISMNNQKEINVEIQLIYMKYWKERSLFYLCKMFSDQLHEGEEYGELEQCIHIGILDFNLFPDDKEYYSCFHLWEDSRKRQYSDKLELHVLELPKLGKHQYPEDALLKWANFLNGTQKEEMEAVAKTDKYVEKAY
ncbi:MAG: Rpn family recombination-promoting nuclease/putative transposase, partial [Lachnospiraceae bacterium]|nr:Rpn family recombination-promoting nuclease/putative transposase [Lachnospiraceae bacterium]